MLDRSRICISLVSALPVWARKSSGVRPRCATISECLEVFSRHLEALKSFRWKTGLESCLICMLIFNLIEFHDVPGKNTSFEGRYVIISIFTPGLFTVIIHKDRGRPTLILIYHRGEPELHRREKPPKCKDNRYHESRLLRCTLRLSLLLIIVLPTTTSSWIPRICTKLLILATV